MAFRKANSLIVITSLSIALVAGVGSMGCDSASTAPNGTPGGILGIGNTNNNNSGGNNNGTGSGTIDPGTGTGNAQADISNTLGATMTAVSLGLGQAFNAPPKTQIADTKAQTIQTQTVTCPSSGDETVDGDVSAGASGFSYTLDYAINGCAGINGSVNAQGSGQLNGTTVDFNYQLDGDVGGKGCTVTFNQLGINVSGASTGAGTTPPPTTINGSLSATCGNANVNCTYNNVNSNDSAALAASCN
ncbi:MAG: hypothetical protein U1F57_10735 [bacterium]